MVRGTDALCRRRPCPRPRSGHAFGTAFPRLLALVLVIGLACAPEGPSQRAAEGPSRAAPTPRQATDLVYLVGPAPERRLLAVAMPEGKLTAELPGARFATLVPEEGFGLVVTNARDDPPEVSPPLRGELERWRAYLDRIDLRTAERAVRVDAGTVSLSERESRFGPLLAAPAVLERGAAFLLARRDETAGPVARFDLYDGRSGALRASRSYPLDDVVGGSSLALAVALTLRPLDAENVLVVRRTTFSGRRRSDWWLFGTDLVRRASVVKASGFASAPGEAIAWSHWCAADVRPVPALAAWVTLCEDDASNRVLLLAETATLREVAAVGLPGTAATGRTLAWHAREDASVVVVTEGPQVLRADLRTRRLLEARRIAPSPALPFDRFPVSGADSPNLTQLGPDGRFAYLAQLDGVTRRFLTAVHLDSARVVATQLSGLDVRGIRPAADGTSVYALASEAPRGEPGPLHLFALDARTLAVLARAGPLDPAPLAIAAAVRR